MKIRSLNLKSGKSRFNEFLWNFPIYLGILIMLRFIKKYLPWILFLAILDCCLNCWIVPKYSQKFLLFNFILLSSFTKFFHFDSIFDSTLNLVILFNEHFSLRFLAILERFFTDSRTKQKHNYVFQLFFLFWKICADCVNCWLAESIY